MNKKDILNKLKSLDGLNNEERAYLVSLINSNKKYGLVWEDKPEAIEEELRIKLPILKEIKERAIVNDNENEQHSNHILIEGDNLHALTALTFTHENKIDLIYIDPPYNTGNKDFIYNDHYVDKEDSYRHSKWLSFISKRLKVAKKLISEKGKIVISIGYQEMHNLLLLCKEIFPGKQVVSITVQTSGGKPSSGFNYLQEYLIYIVDEDFSPVELSFAGGISRSPFEGLTLSTFSKVQRPNQVYPIYIDRKTHEIIGVGPSLTELKSNGSYSGKLDDYKYQTTQTPNGACAVWPITSKGKDCVWRLVGNRLISDWNNGYIKVSKRKPNINPNDYSIQYLPSGVIDKVENNELQIVGKEKGVPTLKFGNNQTVGGDVPTIWSEKKFFTNKGSALIRDILDGTTFSYPKPIDLIKEVILSCVEEDSIILDFFAGSGTAMHAAIELQRNIQCLLVTNNENNIAEEVTYERNKRVIQGYTNAKGVEVEGLKNNNLRYFQCDFVERTPTMQNKRNLTQLSTELLCIKEDCYHPVDHGLNFSQKEIQVFTNKNGKFLVVVYYSRNQLAVQEELVAWIGNLEGATEKVRLYAFSPEKEILVEEFFEVEEKIEVVPLPEAIYNAYLSTIKTLKVDKQDYILSNAEEVIKTNN